jgi:RNA polymerase sigma-70 factor (ECF subfamily)
MDAMSEGKGIPVEELLAQTGWMRALARSLVGDDDLAEDLVQESLARALERPPREPGALSAWLRTVLSRRAWQVKKEGRARERRERRSARPEGLDATPADVLERVELHSQVVDLVRALEEPYRSAILLRYFEGWSTKEIARRQGIEATTVSWRLRKALQQLRGRLDRLHGGRAAWGAAFTSLFLGSRSAGAAVGAGTTALLGAPARWALLGAAIMKLKTIAIAAVLSLLLLAGLGFFLPRAWRGGEAPPSPPDVSTAAAIPAPAVPEPPAASAGSAEPRPGAEPEVAAVLAPEGPAISGLVTDRDSGEPLPGAVVRVRDGSARAAAGEEGVYRLAGLESAPGKEHYLIAARDGYAEEHARARLEEAGDFLQDFQLEPAVKVQVTVVDAEGKPLEDVEVTAAQPNGSYTHGEPYSRRTDREGKALLTGIGRRRKQQVNARKEGFQEVWSRAYEIEPDSDLAELAIVMQARLTGEAVVAGRVTDREGAPLAGAGVQWIHSHGEHRGRVTAQTGRDGSYRLVFPREQDWCAISASAAGFAASIREGVRPGNAAEPARVDFTLLPGHWLEGVVVDEEDRPVEGATIRALPTIYLLRNTPLHPGNAREARTDARGRFRLWDLSGPRAALRIEGPSRPEAPGVDWANNYHPEVEVDRKVTLRLLRWGVLRGRVADRDTGEPVSIFKIQLKKGAGYYDYHRADPGEVFNSPQGVFSLEKLDQGKIEFLVEAEGYIPKWIRELAAEPAERAPAHDVRITRGRFLEGIVIDGASGAPLAEARVVFGAWEGSDLSWDEGSRQRIVDRQDLRTGPDGLFRVREGEPGTLFVERQGYARVALGPAELKQIIAATGRLSVALDAGSALGGILLVDGKPSREGFLVLHRRRPAGGESSREWLGNLDRDPAGKFRIEDLPAGEYYLEHWRETPGKKTPGLSIQRRVRLRAGEEETVEFGADLGPFSFQGRLLGRDGKPLDRTRLALRPDFEWTYSELAAGISAEHDGRFHFLGLRPGRYSLEVADREGRKVALPPLEIEADLERDLTAAPE